MSKSCFVAVVLFLGGLAALRLDSLPALPFCNRPAHDAHFLALQPGEELVQTITARWDDFTRLRIRVQPGQYSTDELEVKLAEQTGSAPLTPWIQLRMPLRTATADGYLDIDFHPILASRGRTFRLTLRNIASSPLGLWVNSRDTYPGGELSAPGRGSGDLVFAAFSARHEPVEFLRAMTRGRPWPLSSFWAVLACVALFAVVAGWSCVEAFRITRGSD